MPSVEWLIILAFGMYPSYFLIRGFLQFVVSLLLRPIGLRLGLMTYRPDDLVVEGWNAEREGRWSEALQAYDSAIAEAASDADIEARRAWLLERQPDLRQVARASEQRWFESLDPAELLTMVSGSWTERKLRLLVVACVQKFGWTGEDAERLKFLEKVREEAEFGDPAIAIEANQLLTVLSNPELSLGRKLLGTISCREL